MAHKKQKLCLGVNDTLLFTDSNVLKEKIDEYFLECDSRMLIKTVDGKKIKINYPRPYTLEGLAVHIGLTTVALLKLSRSGAYSHFHNILKWARQCIAARHIEEALMSRYNANMVKFLLVNHESYVERQELAAVTPVSMMVTTSSTSDKKPDDKDDND